MRASWLALPSFVTLVWAIFWCPVLAVLASTLQWWRLRGPRNDTLAM